MTVARSRAAKSFWRIGCILLLLASACGGDSDKTVASESSTSAPATTTPPTPQQTQPSTSATVSGSANRATIPTTAPPTTPETPVDLNLIPQKDNVSVSFGKATINGTDYTRALIMDPIDYSDVGRRLEIDAGRRRTRFLGDLGIPDTERSSTAYKVDISFDSGAPELSAEVRFGETTKIDLPITNVLRIKILITPLTSTSSSSTCCALIAIGEPRLR